jgi:hypothetical protein
MQSVSPRFPARVMQRTREALPGGVLWTSLLVFFLTLAVSRSTVTAEWVAGIEVVPLVALVGAILMGPARPDAHPMGRRRGDRHGGGTRGGRRRGLARAPREPPH